MSRTPIRMSSCVLTYAAHSPPGSQMALILYTDPVLPALADRARAVDLDRADLAVDWAALKKRKRDRNHAIDEARLRVAEELAEELKADWLVVQRAVRA